MPYEGLDNPGFAEADNSSEPPKQNIGNGSELAEVNLYDYPVKTDKGAVVKSPDGDTRSSAPSTVQTGTVEPGSVVDCGYGPCRPSVLQMCNSPKVFIIWLSWFTFVQGFVVNGVNNLNTTTIEKRFNLPSSKVGLISSIYDISAGLFVIPITVYGSMSHQPRLLSFAAFCMSVGSFIMALPHFTTGLYDLGDPIAETCSPLNNGTSTECEGGGGISNYLYVFLLGQFLNGIGGTTLYTLGYVYIDSNVSTKSSPIYQGIMLMCSTLGPAVGFLTGGFMLSYYVDIDQVDASKLSITEEDPRWVGAWWVCFLIASGLLVSIVILMYPYPKLMPAGIKAQSKRINQAHDDGSIDVVSQENFLTSWRDVPTSFKFVLTNPVLIFLTLGLITEGINLSGFATFIPKIIQNQFGQTASWSAQLAGFIVVPAAFLGNLTSSLILRFMKLRVKGMLKLSIICCFTSLAFGFIVLLRCDVATLAGVAVPYSEQANSTKVLGEYSLDSTCNAHCGCTTESYEPICGVDKIQYFSPCHAGCGHSVTIDGDKMYNNCSCIENAMSTDPDATEGPCSLDCNMMGVFLAISCIFIYLTFMVNVPTVSVTLRCLPDKQRLIAIGVQAVFTRFLGTFPGPLLFGAVFDLSCIQWQEICDDQGSCWVYDNTKLSINLLILAFVVKFLSAIFFSGALYFYKPPPEVNEVEMEGFENKTYQNGSASVADTNTKEDKDKISPNDSSVMQ